MLWLSLDAALLLQLLATQWGPATRLFGTTGMAWADWAVAAGTYENAKLLGQFELRRQVIAGAPHLARSRVSRCPAARTPRRCAGPSAARW